MNILSITAHHALPSPGSMDLGRHTIAASDVDSMERTPDGVLYRFAGRTILAPWASLRYVEFAPQERTAPLMDVVGDALDQIEPAKPAPKRKPKAA